jgi:hypothetical protein
MFYSFIINFTFIITSNILLLSDFINYFTKSKIGTLQSNFIFNKEKEIINSWITKLNLIEIKDEFLSLESYDKSNYFINKFYNNTVYRKVRISEFYSTNKQMLNIVWYPQYHYDIPILNIDLIRHKDDVSICFINLFEVQSKFNELFLSVKTKYPNFFKEKPLLLLPFKYLLSDSMIFSYIYDDEKLTKIQYLIDDYIANYISIKNIANENIDDIKNKHKEYNFIRYKIDKNVIIDKKFDITKLKNIINTIYNKYL